MHIGYLYRLSDAYDYVLVLSKEHIISVRQEPWLRDFQFVVYSEAGLEPVSEYKLKEGRDCNDRHMMQMISRHCFIIDSAGNRQQVYGAEKFIIEQLFAGKMPLPVRAEDISDSFHREASSIFEKVQYVYAHLSEIAESYRASIDNGISYRRDDSDIVTTELNTDILYRDSYINKFFPESGIIDRYETYGNDLGYPKGRLYEKEVKCRKNFIDNYSRQEHIEALFHDLYATYLTKADQQNRNNNLYACYWGLIINSIGSIESVWGREYFERKWREKIMSL